MNWNGDSGTRFRKSVWPLVILAMASSGFVCLAFGEEIVVGRLYESDHVALMRDLASAYEAIHPNVTFRILSEDIHTDLTTYQAEIGPLPDIFTLAVHVFKRIHELPFCVQNDLLVPIEDLAPNHVQESGHYPSLWQCIEYKGKHWGTPYYAESYGLVMKRANTPSDVWDAPPRTWAELRDVAASLTKEADGDGSPENWGIAAQSREDLPVLWLALASQLGAVFWRDGQYAIAQDSALREAYAMLADMRDVKALLPRDSAKCSISYVQSWQLNDDIARTSSWPPQYWSRSEEIKVIPMPSVGTGAAIPVLNVYLAIKKTTPEKQAICWDFVQWACSVEPQLEFAVQKRGFLPIHEATATSPVFKEKTVKMPHLQVFVDTLAKVAPVFPVVENGDKAFARLAQEFDRVFRSGADINAALVDVEQRINVAGQSE
jgi:multiple sugar transport system substrate-binding protein